MNSRCLRAAAGSGTRSAATIDGRARVSAMVSAPGEACATRRGARRRRGHSLARAASSSSGKTGRASDGVGPAARHAPPAAQAGGGRGLPVPPTGGAGGVRRAARPYERTAEPFDSLVARAPGRTVERGRRCWSPCRDAGRHYKDEAGGAARVIEAHGKFTPLEENAPVGHSSTRPPPAPASCGSLAH